MSTCAHCGKSGPLAASVGDARLCHPDDGMDCYRLVTVYRHPAPCPGCDGQLARVGMTPEETLRASLDELADAIRQG